MKKQLFIIDTSAILSGKPINLVDAEMATTPSVSDELQPGGRDYRTLQFLQEKGLVIQSPSEESIRKIKKSSVETGDKDRLSCADVDILALALDVNKKDENQEAVILTDDYSIQNVANALNIKFQSFSQIGITKKFKWHYRCPGCGKQFKTSIKICPVCGTETKISIGHKNHMK
ncbi:MAG: NOB1 family endonuclease [Thermoplasmatales archaeon]|nr:MAG: NOB1 family endonuclease [Thermoplasmatales archaeon]